MATVCNDSVSYLYQLAGRHRRASALMATRIEEATRRVARRSGGRLRPVPRESLVRHPEIFCVVRECGADYTASGEEP